MTKLAPLPINDPTIGKEIIQKYATGDRKVRVLRYETDDMNEGYAVRIIEQGDPNFGRESWMSAASVAKQLGSDDEFRRIRAYGDQKIDEYLNLDQDVRDLLSDYDERGLEITRLKAELEAKERPPLKLVPMVDDTLQTLLDKQHKLMGMLGIPKLEEGAEYLGNQYFIGAVLGMVTEAAEVVDALSTASKPWKQVPLEKMRALVLEETIDVLFMLLETLDLAGLDATDIMDRYDDKLKFNLDRLLRTTNNNHPLAKKWLEELNAVDMAAGLDRHYPEVK